MRTDGAGDVLRFMRDKLRIQQTFGGSVVILMPA